MDLDNAGNIGSPASLELAGGGGVCGSQILPTKKKLFSFEDGSDLFSLNGLGRQLVLKKMKEGKAVQKHANGKVNLAAMVDDPSTMTNICPYCNFTFVHKFVLSRHIKQIHEKHKLITYQCPKCEYSTVRKDQMRSHYSVVHENFKPYRCSLCSFRAPKSFRVTSHLQKTHSGNGVVIHDTEMRPAPVSPPRTSPQDDDERNHSERGSSTLREEGEQDVVVVDASLKVARPDAQLPTLETANAADSSQSELTVAKVGSATCARNRSISIVSPMTNLASPTFLSRSTPTLLSNGGSQRLYECPDCNYQTSDQVQMGDHTVSGHEDGTGKATTEKASPGVPKVSECQQCSKPFRSNRLLVDHFRKDHPYFAVNLHVCHLCSSQFYNEIRLKNHMESAHPGAKNPFRCESCHLAFRTAGFLHVHVRRRHPERNDLINKLRKNYNVGTS